MGSDGAANDWSWRFPAQPFLSLPCPCVYDPSPPAASAAAPAAPRRTLQDFVFQTYVIPEHYFLQIDPQAAGAASRVSSCCAEGSQVSAAP